MMGELFKMASGANLMHVPYRGVGPALNDALAGQVDVLYDNLPRRCRTRNPAAWCRWPWPGQARGQPADVPTFAEAGLPAVNDASWFGLVAPAKLPQPVLDKLNAAVRKVSADPDVKARLEALGAAPAANSPAEFAAQISAEIARTSASPKKPT